MSQWLERNFFSLTLLSVLLICMSILAWLKIPLEVTPAEQTPSFLFLKAGMTQDYAPVQAEASITQLVEGAVKTLPGLIEYSSRTASRAVSVSITLRPGTSLDLATVQLQEALQPIIERGLIDPKGVSIARFNPDASSMVRMSISDEAGLLDLPVVISEEIRPLLEAIPEVSKVELTSAEPDNLNMDLSIGRLRGLGIEPETLRSRARPTSVRESLGQMLNADRTESVSVRAKLTVESLDQFRNQVVSSASALRLGDLAPLRLSPAYLKTASHVQGKQAVFVELFLRDRADPFALERKLKATIQQIESNPRFRDALKINWVMNRVDDLRGALADVQSSLIQSVMITFGVIFLFIRKLGRTALISATIPLTLILTVALLYIGGFTLNIMTLSGLILGIGMVVDNVILVVDRTVELRAQGIPLGRALAEAGSQSTPALLMATLTNGIIFLPVAFSDSSDSFVTLLKAFQAPILATLGASLVLAVLMLPALVRPFPRVVASTASETDNPKVRAFFQRVFKHRQKAAFISILGLVFIAERVSSIPQTDLEPPTDPWVTIQLKFGAEVPVTERRSIYDKVEGALLAQADLDFKTLASTYFAGSQAATFQVYPKEASDPDRALISLERRLKDWIPTWRVAPGTKLVVGYESESGGDGQAPRKLLTFEGPRSSELDALLDKLKDDLSKTTGVSRVLAERDAFGTKEFLFAPNEAKLSQMGLTPGELAVKINASLHSGMVGPFQLNGKQVGIKISLHPSDAAQNSEWNLNELERLQLATRSGRLVSLKALGSVVPVSRLSTISRKQGIVRSRLAVEFTEPLYSPKSQVAWRKVQQTANSFEFPPGYGPQIPESLDKLAQMQKNMMFMMLLSSLLIYLVLGAAFESLFMPVIVLFTIPGAILSGVFGLWLMSKDLDVMARLSLVILVGIGVNNAIILLDLIQNLRKQGFSRKDAVVLGCTQRFRAILMTTSIQILGVLPVALGNSKIMGIPYASLGIAVISGMTLSTIMTFAIIPWMYDIVSRLEDSSVLSPSLQETASAESSSSQGKRPLPLEPAA